MPLWLLFTLALKVGECDTGPSPCSLSLLGRSGARAARVRAGRRAAASSSQQAQHMWVPCGCMHVLCHMAEEQATRQAGHQRRRQLHPHRALHEPHEHLAHAALLARAARVLRLLLRLAAARARRPHHGQRRAADVADVGHVAVEQGGPLVGEPRAAQLVRVLCAAAPLLLLLPQLLCRAVALLAQAARERGVRVHLHQQQGASSAGCRHLAHQQLKALQGRRGRRCPPASAVATAHPAPDAAAACLWACRCS